MTYLEEELPLVCLITFLFLLLSIPLVFNSHQHKEPSCVCDFDNKEGKKKRKAPIYNLLEKKKTKTGATSSRKLLKKTKKTKKEDDDSSSSTSSSSSSSSSSSEEVTKKRKTKPTKPKKQRSKVLEKMPMMPTRQRRVGSKKKSKKVKTKKVEEEQQVKVKLELEPVEGDGKTETKVDFKLDVEVDPNTPGKEPLTTHLEGQVAHNVPLMHLLTDSPQVEGNEMDVEMEGKTKDDGNMVLEGSVQQGKDQVEKH